MSQWQTAWYALQRAALASSHHGALDSFDSTPAARATWYAHRAWYEYDCYLEYADMPDDTWHDEYDYTDPDPGPDADLLALASAARAALLTVRAAAPDHEPILSDLLWMIREVADAVHEQRGTTAAPWYDV